MPQFLYYARDPADCHQNSALDVNKGHDVRKRINREDIDDEGTGNEQGSNPTES